MEVLLPENAPGASNWTARRISLRRVQHRRASGDRPEAKMAHVEPRQAAPLANVDYLRPESLERLQVASRRLAGTVEQQENVAPRWPSRWAMAMVLSSASLIACWPAAQRSVLVNDERLHAAQIPQCAFTVEHLRRADRQKRLRRIRRIRNGGRLHMQHIGERAFVANLIGSARAWSNICFAVAWSFPRPSPMPLR